jgi:selenocysteine lyase/cysteine desulfurase
MSPLLRSAESAGIEGLLKKRNPWRVTVDDFFGDTHLLRLEFAKLVAAPNPAQIVVIPSVSYGIANIVQNVRIEPQQEIVVVSEQFASNVYPWQRLCAETGCKLRTVSAPEKEPNRGHHWNTRILESITTHTRVVAIGHVHWVDGTLFDLQAIRKRTRDVGAWLIIDGTQSVGAYPFDIASIQPDALICAGYKWLLGPYSIGLAYYSEEFNDGTPVEENWINRLHSEDFSSLVNYQPKYHPGALRYEVGEHSNFILVPMLLAALRQLNEWTPQAIQQYCQSITKHPIAMLENKGYWVEQEQCRGHHLFGIRVENQQKLQRAKQQLEDRHISVSYRGDVIRVSPHLFNSKDDLLALVDALPF